MSDQAKTQEELIQELEICRQRIADLEKLTAERKEAAKALHESEEVFSLLFEKSGDANLLIKDGRYIDCNEAALKLMGCHDKSCLINLTPADISPERQPDGALSSEKSKRMDEIALREGSNRFEWVRKRFDGTELHSDIMQTPISLQGEKIIYLTWRDITEKKHAEEALRISRLQLAEAMDLAHIVYWEVDPITLDYIFNDPFYAFCGTTAEREGGYTMKMVDYEERFIHPDDIPLYRESVEQNAIRIDHEFLADMEHRIIRRTGEVRHIRVRTRAQKDSSGRIIRIYGANQDITESKLAEEDRRQLESKLLQAQKMESIGTLAGGIAHDFNNLLMGVQGYVSLMLLDLDRGHHHYDWLKNIETQVQSGADLTRQLLGFARAGRYDVKPLQLNAVLQKSVDMFGRTKKEITIHQKYGEYLWLVEADRGQIEQILLNLFVNAWQAMPSGGDIFLETQNTVLDEHYAKTVSAEPGRYVKVAITDTGIGMDKGTTERIFEPFFTTKAMGRGTGLGLAMVYGIVRGHQGVINVYSEKGHGTTFNIYLPAAESKVLTPDAEASSKTMRGDETILLIDDEEMILTVSGELLKNLGYRTIAANGGQEAIEIYRSQKDEIDLVLLDMVMPGLSGGETFDQIKALDPAVKVILASGYSINGQAAGILGRGCRAFIQKPFTLSDLSQKIRTVLDA